MPVLHNSFHFQLYAGVREKTNTGGYIRTRAKGSIPPGFT
jgi:hypothetical protein